MLYTLRAQIRLGDKIFLETNALAYFVTDEGIKFYNIDVRRDVGDVRNVDENVANSRRIISQVSWV